MIYRRRFSFRAMELLMTGAEVREVMEAVLPAEEIELLCRELGVVERERKLEVAVFARSMVLAAGTPSGARQADVLRAYVESGGTPVARSAGYRWFDEALERLMATLSERAMAYARTMELDLPGILGGVSDWVIVDSTTVRICDDLIEQYPGTGDYAALKVHKLLSVGCGVPISYHFSPAREHDSRHLKIDETWSGRGLLADLGYASIDRLRACVRHDVKFVIRLKDNWKPRVQEIHRGDVHKTFFAGADFDTLIEDETLVLEGRAVDASVEIGSGAQALALRLVGVPTPKGYCWYLTNLPRKLGPVQIGTLYRVRWEIELSMKLDKSVHHMAQAGGTQSDNVHALRALLHASLIASVIAGLLVHRHNLSTRPRKPGQPRTAPPLHVRLLALQLATSAQSIAHAFELTGDEADHAWDRVALVLTHSGKDPNWRRSPSVLDELRGWKPARKPAKPKPNILK